MPDFSQVYRQRGYRHLDEPIGFQRAAALATNTEAVERHAFLPFIRRDTKEPRYRKEQRKVEKKPRALAYASHADSVIYSWYGALLSEQYEALLDRSGIAAIPTAFRTFPGRKCNVHFALEAFQFIQQARPCVVLCFDISGFFDNLDHALLLAAWQDTLGVDRIVDGHFQVFRSLTRWSWVPESKLYKTLNQSMRHRPGQHGRLCDIETFRLNVRGAGMVETNLQAKGIPQGSPMSGVLSNVYMVPFDLALQRLTDDSGGFVRRYCDDVIVVVPPEWKERAESAVNAAAEERRLNLNPGKTEMVVFGSGTGREARPVQYLGLTYDGQDILLRGKTVSRFYRRLRGYMRRAAYRAARNPVRPRIYRRTLKLRFTASGKRNFHSYLRLAKRVSGSEKVGQQLGRVSEVVSQWELELLERYAK